MFGLFKTNPLKQLQKRHVALLAEAHRMSTRDRSKSDALMAQAAAVEEEMIQLTNNSDN